MSDTYYPTSQGDQVDWNTNILAHPELFPGLGFSPTEVLGIADDCQFTIFLLTNVGEMADSTYASLHGYAQMMERNPPGAAILGPPVLPTWPAQMPMTVAPGIGARRSAWVMRAKASPSYNAATVGRTLRLEPVHSPFDPAGYTAQLLSVQATGHEQVQVKIGKAGGQVSAAQLRMQRGADPAFKTVGMFTARAYVDHTPLLVPGVPEERSYQLLAMKNDAVIGQPSPILKVVVG